MKFIRGACMHGAQSGMMLEPTNYKILIDALKAIPWQYCYLLIYFILLLIVNQLNPLGYDVDVIIK